MRGAGALRPPLLAWRAGLLDGGLRFRPMTLPDAFIECGDYRDQLAQAGLTAGQIAGTALQVLGRAKDAAKFSIGSVL